MPQVMRRSEIAQRGADKSGRLPIAVRLRRPLVAVSCAKQGSGDQESPDEEPRIPEVGVPGQSSVIGRCRGGDDTELHHQPHGGQYQP